MVNAMISWEQEHYDSPCYLFPRTPVKPLFPLTNRQVLHTESEVVVRHCVGVTCDTTLQINKNRRMLHSEFGLPCSPHIGRHKAGYNVRDCTNDLYCALLLSAIPFILTVVFSTPLHIFYGPSVLVVIGAPWFPPGGSPSLSQSASLMQSRSVLLVAVYD